MFFFFFKEKTAYEMRISDWSSDVCSSDLNDPRLKRHDLGFLEVVDKPTSEELKAYYAHRYYQTEQGNYRKAYPQAERDYFNLKIAQKAALVDKLQIGRR